MDFWEYGIQFQSLWFQEPQTTLGKKTSINSEFITGMGNQKKNNKHHSLPDMHKQVNT